MRDMQGGMHGHTVTLTYGLSLFAPLLIAVVRFRALLQKLILRMRVRGTL